MSPPPYVENEKVEVLFRFIKELKENGVSIIYISHRLEEIMDICDSVTVLKDGTYVDTKPVRRGDQGFIDHHDGRPRKCLIYTI